MALLVVRELRCPKVQACKEEASPCLHLAYLVVAFLLVAFQQVDLQLVASRLVEALADIPEVVVGTKGFERFHLEVGQMVELLGAYFGYRCSVLGMGCKLVATSLLSQHRSHPSDQLIP